MNVTGMNKAAVNRCPWRMTVPRLSLLSLAVRRNVYDVGETTADLGKDRSGHKIRQEKGRNKTREEGWVVAV